jgi:hypothetical protein
VADAADRTRRREEVSTGDGPLGSVPPPRPTGPAVSAPDLTGPTSILNWPVASSGKGRKARARPYSHVHLEIDLEPDGAPPSASPIVRKLEALVREREVVESADLLGLAARLLHALSAAGFTRVAAWSFEPDVTLPSPATVRDRTREPVGHLLDALRDSKEPRLATARSFSVTLTEPGPNRVEALLRRVHRERRHSLSLDLRGTIPEAGLKEIVTAVRERLPVRRSAVTAYARH